MSQSVGEQLKQARLARGLSLDEVTKAIYVRSAYLEALENDQHSRLPSAVQGRGYLRLYADFLNLPAAPLLEAWEGKGPPPAAEPPQAEEGGQETEPKPAPRAPAPPPPPPTFATLPADTRSWPPTEQDASHAIFVEIGQKLQRQREALGLSLAEVERYTKLRQHYLQALEQGRLDQLPSPVQGRGMLSNYVTFLNLNEDQLMLQFAEGLQQRRLERIPAQEAQPPAAKKRPVRQASPLRQFLTPDLIFGVIVVSAILFFAVRTAASINDLRSQETLPTAPAIAEVLLSTSTPSLAPGETAVESAGIVLTLSPQAAFDPLSTDAAAEGNITFNTPAVRPDGGTIEPEPPPAIDPGTAVPQPTVAPINNDPLQVYIIARQRAWLRVTADNRELFNGRVVAGNAYAYSGARRIELLTGNAAALQVFFNQQDMGTLGVAGQVVNLVFLPEGVQTPTATATATPTITPRVTNTPTPSITPQVTQTITPFVP